MQLLAALWSCTVCIMCTGAVEQRVTELELGVDEMRQQLSAVLSQQEELKGLLTRLLAGLEATGISSPRQAVSQLQRLGTTVSHWAAQGLVLEAWVSSGAQGDACSVL